MYDVYRPGDWETIPMWECSHNWADWGMPMTECKWCRVKGIRDWKTNHVEIIKSVKKENENA